MTEPHSLFQALRNCHGYWQVKCNGVVVSAHDRRSDAEAWIDTVTRPFSERA